MGKVRLHDLMRRFGVGIDTLVAFLNDRGACLCDVTPNTKVSDTYVEAIEEFLREDKSMETPHDAPMKVRMTRQEKFNVSYIANLTQIAVIEESLADGEDAALRARIEELYCEREILERSPDRIDSFIVSHPEYAFIMDDVERRRNEIRSRARSRLKLISRVLDVTQGQCREYAPEEELVVLYIPWSRIELQDGRIILDYSKGIRIPVSCPMSRGAYVTSVRMFRQKPQPVEVAVHSKGYFIRNPEIIDGMMELLALYDRISSLIIRHQPVSVNIGRVNRIPPDLFRCMFPVGDSPYLNHLLGLQDGGCNYIPLHESHVGCPDGYLFTVRTAEGYRVVWECVQMSERRSTYVFYADEDEVPCLLQFLSDFITSGKSGKRNALRRKNEKEFYGFRYASIKHDDIQAWKGRLAALLSSPAHPRRCQEYDGILYPAFIQWLEKSGHTDVAPGRDESEVVAVAPDGIWHAFEVKESSREWRIRESLGWILGHAHYYGSSRPDRLTIVGTQKITEEQKKSLMHLRKMYGLQVRYACFDIQSSVLHEHSDSWE